MEMERVVEILVVGVAVLVRDPDGVAVGVRVEVGVPEPVREIDRVTVIEGEVLTDGVFVGVTDGDLVVLGRGVGDMPLGSSQTGEELVF